MKCKLFALTLALGALLCTAPAAAALDAQPEDAPAPDAAVEVQADEADAPAEEEAIPEEEATEEEVGEVTVTVEVPILPEKPPVQISYTTPEEIGFVWEDGLELEVTEEVPVEEVTLDPAAQPDADAASTETAAPAAAPAGSTAPTKAVDTAPATPTLPQTGIQSGLVRALFSAGFALLTGGWLLSRKTNASSH